MLMPRALLAASASSSPVASAGPFQLEVVSLLIHVGWNEDCSKKAQRRVAHTCKDNKLTPNLIIEAVFAFARQYKSHNLSHILSRSAELSLYR